ncbi:MAG: type IV pilus biogenesis protein PilP [Rhodospirillales bacterium]|nr:type IV pilus biogenesis protein PilP [Rhodospirillales bacterium]
MPRLHPDKTARFSLLPRFPLAGLRLSVFLLLLFLFVGGSSRAQETGLSALASRLMNGGWGGTVDLDDPCPAPGSSETSAGDMALLQADIDRFSLCAERAESLKKLNEATMGKKGAEGVGPAEPNPLLDNPGFRLRRPPEDRGNQIAIPPVPEKDLEPPRERESKPKRLQEWSIVNIFGSSGGLQVRLRKDDGSVAQARAGAVLSDGWTVKQVSTSGVVLGKAGQPDKTLTWMD